jgi:hypothetical protein
MCIRTYPLCIHSSRQWPFKFKFELLPSMSQSLKHKSQILFCNSSTLATIKHSTMMHSHDAQYIAYNTQVIRIKGYGPMVFAIASLL